MIELSKNDLKELVEQQGFPRISLFMPTHRVTANTEEDRIRLKNLLNTAEERLVAGGLRAPEAVELLEPARRLNDDGLFWRYQSDGLALFLARDVFRHFRVPVEFSELVVVSERFHVKPLLPLLTGEGRFYVLALSQDQVRLLQGSRRGLAEVDLAGVPKSLAETLRDEGRERHLLWHTRAAPRGGERAAMFYGHGSAQEDSKPRILRYFQQIDRGLQELLSGQRVPLVLAGVEYYFPIYREANSYPHLVPEGITGSPNGLSDEELYRRAWAILEPRFRADQERALSTHLELSAANPGRTSHDLEEILRAAWQGRVENLFVAVDREVWGKYDPQTEKVEIHESPQPGDDDLLNVAAMRCLLHGARVDALRAEEVPHQALIAATFRY
jgi:hypothetical protein